MKPGTPLSKSTNPPTALQLRHVQAAVLTEGEASRAERERTQALPLSERVATGVALIGLRADAHAQGLRLAFTDNLSKFKVGDSLSLLRGAACVQVRLIEEAREHLVVAAGSPWARLGPEHRGDGWSLEPAEVDLEEMTLGALSRIPKHRLDAVLAFASGARRAEATRPFTLPNPLLSARQREALELALGSTDPLLVQGPPGTGKTYVLAQLVAQLVAEGKRVLLTAFTHHAVHNALRAVAKVAPSVALAKLGHASIAAELPDAIERIPDRSALAQRLAQRGPLVLGATTHAALLTLDDRRGAGTLDFDVVVLDEASQASLPTGVAALCRAPRAVLFGDHRQMAPVVQGTYSDERLSKSVFELLWRAQPGVMLDITHRMNKELCALPSRAWYGGELRPSPAAADRRLRFPCVDPADVLHPDTPETFLFRAPGEGADQRSPTEARLIAEQVRRLVDAGIPAKEIAVIAPFRVQVREIRRALATLPGSAFEEVTVDTVERIQGQERDVIFLSFAVDAAAAADPSIRFFTPERLNVALTRARVKRILVGAEATIRGVIGLCTAGVG